MHILCTICSDLVNQAESIITTKCGHIFHHHCLGQWIERAQSCPQCRNKVTKKCMFRIYPTIASDVTGDDAATLQSRLDNAQLQLRELAADCKEKEDKLAGVAAELKKQEDASKSLEKKLVTQYAAVSALREQLEYVKVQNKETQKLKEDNETLTKSLQTLNGLQKVLNATSAEVEEMLQGYTEVRTVATFATALKRALCDSEAKKNKCRDRLQAAKQQIGLEKQTCADWQAKFMQVKESLAAAERRYSSLRKRKASESVIEDSVCAGSSSKVQRVSDVGQSSFSAPSNVSIGTLVSKIENAESPYLNLRQSSLALTALQRPASDAKLKPSEFTLLNSARNIVTKKSGLENVPSNLQRDYSIFHTKDPIKIVLDDKKEAKTDLDMSYDGLGGHSRLDMFPVPKNLIKPKSSVPKLTSKHRLKRPATKDNQDIAAMFRIRDK